MVLQVAVRHGNPRLNGVYHGEVHPQEEYDRFVKHVHDHGGYGNTSYSMQEFVYVRALSRYCQRDHFSKVTPTITIHPVQLSDTADPRHVHSAPLVFGKDGNSVDLSDLPEGFFEQRFEQFKINAVRDHLATGRLRMDDAENMFMGEDGSGSSSGSGSDDVCSDGEYIEVYLWPGKETLRLP